MGPETVEYLIEAQRTLDDQRVDVFSGEEAPIQVRSDQCDLVAYGRKQCSAIGKTCGKLLSVLRWCQLLHRFSPPCATVHRGAR